jgi:hypothetical protein
MHGIGLSQCIRHGGIILYFYKKCIEMSGEEGTR